METLRDAFIDELKDMLHAEKQLVKALPKLAKASNNEELRDAFEKHLEETKNHVRRLEQIFELLDQKPKTKSCKGMSGIIDEGKSVISDGDKGDTRDAALICGAQKAEHYEIATYGSLCAWAEQMGNKEVERLLRENMNEERAADEVLTQIATRSINRSADGGAQSMEAW